MQTIQIPNLADQMGELPAEGIRRERQLHRLIDLHAATEAAAALHAAAARAGEDPDSLASVLRSAEVMLDGSAAVRGLLTEDATALDRLRDAAISPGFLSLLPEWICELRESASSRPETGACTVASALELWLWTTNHFRTEGIGMESASRAIDDLIEALCPLLAARCLALEVTATTSAETELRADLCHVYAARSSALAGALCAELVFGYRRHLVWDAEGCATCFESEELDELEAMMPGFASGAGVTLDVIDADGTHPAKAGPCARMDGLAPFLRLRTRLDGCLTGARIAKHRAAATIASSFRTSPAGGRA
ncbi:MAG TPA: hypothetical protein VF701_07925 [Thermoanaerobaculia bacterium]